MDQPERIGLQDGSNPKRTAAGSATRVTGNQPHYPREERKQHQAKLDFLADCGCDRDQRSNDCDTAWREFHHRWHRQLRAAGNRMRDHQRHDHGYQHCRTDQRREENAYLLGGITEFWRAYRKYAAVLHFVYLTASDPKGFTCDHFRDVKTLELDPYFVDYMGNAFKPLGVYVNFWHDQLPANSHQIFQVMLANDLYETESGSLDLNLENEKGGVIARSSTPFSVAPLGQQTQFIDFNVPAATGKFMLKAIAKPSQGPERDSTISRRRVEVVAQK